ncbi:MAG: peptidoglycan DD-metalloendopeptidase family protein [Beijerinckiaceae bacterium]
MGELNLNARVRHVLRLTAASATAAFLAGCSSDVSRLASGPFGPADNTPTASIGTQPLMPPEAVGGASAAASASAGSWGNDLPSRSSIQSAPLAPVAAAPAGAAVASAAAAGGAAPAARAAAGSFGPWTTAGGTPVTVGQGESASVIAARYGVPMEALIKANGLSSAAQVTPGKSLVIPIYNAGARQAAAPSPAAAPAKAAQNASKTAAKTAKAVAEPVKAQAARAPEAARKAEQKTVAAVDARKPVAAAPAKTDLPKRDAAKQAEAAKSKEAAPSAPAQPAPQVAAAPAANDKPEFRWPARGRIIQGFKSGANDGIAIAVPEGTAVKAAEGGVVAYAGNELKGYGNLVLIKHPNGFVTAYAHNGEINVKRGETVKRGQTIAKSGQTGNVSAPQLHFELRKGSTPVDPTQYLAGL